jgi:HSP20 family molecular chaperone IbpA
MPMSQVQIQKPEKHYDFNDFLFGRLAEHVRRIERRAHQIFEGRGHEHGHDLEDWLQAEREINSDPTVRIETGDTSVAITLATPGYDADHLTVSIAPGSVVVEGKTELRKSSEEDGVTVSEVSAQTLFRQIPLPGMADVDAATADFHGRELRITVPLIEKKGAASEESAPIAKAKSA